MKIWLGYICRGGSGSEWLRGSEKLERGSSFTEVERAGGTGERGGGGGGLEWVGGVGG